MILELPLPPKELHAHNTGHWRSKAAHVKACRESAKLHALAAGVQRFDAAVLSVTFYWPNRIRRDNANALQSLKPAIDGLVDAGVLADDDWKHLDIGGYTAHPATAAEAAAHFASGGIVRLR